MKIAPFELKNYYFFKKTREALFYKLTEIKLNIVESEMERLFAELHHLKYGKNYYNVYANIKENLEYLNEVKSDIVYFRLHGEMRSKKHSLYSKYYQYNRA